MYGKITIPYSASNSVGSRTGVVALMLLPMLSTNWAKCSYNFISVCQRTSVLDKGRVVGSVVVGVVVVGVEEIRNTGISSKQKIQTLPKT